MAYQSKYTGLQIDDILDSVEWKQGKIEDLASIRAGAAKGATALQSYTEKYTGTVTGIKINGVVKSGSGVIDLGTISTDISGKVDKVAGKQLSTEDFTTALKNKLEGLNNYDDTELSEALSTLRGDFDKIVSGDTTTAIKTFNEVIAFLDGLTDTQDLESIIASIEQQIAGKMDKVTLATVATSGSYNDLSNKPTIPSAVTESTVSGWGFTKNTGTYSKPSGGIPKSDLASAVQTSLGKADTAIQSTSFGELTDLALVKGFESSQRGTIYALPDAASGDEDDILLSRGSVKTVNGQSIAGSGDITISGGSNEDSPLKFATDEDGAYSIVSTNEDNYTWYLPNSGGYLVKYQDVMNKLDYCAVGYLHEIYACAKGEIDSTFFEKGPLGSEGNLVIVSTDNTLVAGIVSGVSYNDDDTITFSIYTYDGKCIVITTSYSDEYIYTDEIRIIDFVNLGGGSGGSIDTSNFITSVKVNGQSNFPSSGVVDLGYINKQLSTTTSSSMTLSPNIYYRNTSTSLSTLTITLGSVSNSNIINEYFVEFTTRSAGTTVSLPSTIKWANGEAPTFEASTTYQISIVNNLGVVTKFK